MGLIALHGPHHSAQKSIKTTWSLFIYEGYESKRWRVMIWVPIRTVSKNSGKDVMGVTVIAVVGVLKRIMISARLKTVRSDVTSRPVGSPGAKYRSPAGQTSQHVAVRSDFNFGLWPGMRILSSSGHV